MWPPLCSLPSNTDVHLGLTKMDKKWSSLSMENLKKTIISYHFQFDDFDFFYDEEERSLILPHFTRFWGWVFWGGRREGHRKGQDESLPLHGTALGMEPQLRAEGTLAASFETNGVFFGHFCFLSWWVGFVKNLVNCFSLHSEDKEMWFDDLEQIGELSNGTDMNPYLGWCILKENLKNDSKESRHV